jgi:hypothetical protein
VRAAIARVIGQATGDAIRDAVRVMLDLPEDRWDDDRHEDREPFWDSLGAAVGQEARIRPTGRTTSTSPGHPTGGLLVLALVSRFRRPHVIAYCSGGK